VDGKEQQIVRPHHHHPFYRWSLLLLRPSRPVEHQTPDKRHARMPSALTIDPTDANQLTQTRTHQPSRTITVQHQGFQIK